MSEKSTIFTGPERDDPPRFTREMAERGRHMMGDQVIREARSRGRPRKAEEDRKEKVTIRVSPQVLSHFRERGEGWQTRLDQILVEYVRSAKRGRNDGLDRSARHAQIPIMSKQIHALRQIARSVSDQGRALPYQAAIGFILTSNMMAGFALELGLKIFYMTFCGNGPPNTHSLLSLYNDLPAQIRGDIAATYEHELQDTPIQLYAFMTAPRPPEPPEGGDGKRYDSAISLFESASDCFIKSRYFFENVGAADWSIVDHPIDYLLRMSDGMEVVYEHYAREGSWKAA